MTEEEYNRMVEGHRNNDACPFCVFKKTALTTKGFERHLQYCKVAKTVVEKIRRERNGGPGVPLFAGPTAPLRPEVPEVVGRDKTGRSTRKRGRVDETETATVWSVGDPVTNHEEDYSLNSGHGWVESSVEDGGFEVQEITLEDHDCANLSQQAVYPRVSQREQEEERSLDQGLDKQENMEHQEEPPQSQISEAHATKLERAHRKDGEGKKFWEDLGTMVCSVASRSVLNLCPIKGKLMLSMLRITLFCDESAQQSRSFQDGYTALLKREIAENDLDVMAMPQRATVVRWAYKQFGTKLTKAQAVTVRRTTHANPYDHLRANSYNSPRIDRGLETRDRDLLHVLKFDIVNGCRSLIRNRNLWSDLNNLVVNAQDPFLPYVNPGGGLDEALDGTWWPNMVSELSARGIFDPAKEFIVPLVIYMDKTGTTGNQRYPLEPLVFTFLNIRRALRNLPDFWMMAGYLPDLDGKSSAEKTQHRQRNRGASSETYHRALSVILEVFKELEVTGFSDWVRMGDALKMMRLRFYVAYIIGDGKSADMLANRIGAHKNARRISRVCDCPQKDCASVIHVCKYLKMGTFQHHFKRLEASPEAIMDSIKNKDGITRQWSKEQLIKLFLKDRKLTRKALIEHGIQPSINAFVLNNISFGYDVHGIFGALPTDLMHAFQSGVLPYLLRIALDMLSPAEKATLDELVDRVLYKQRSSCKGDYPRYCFANGFTSLTQLTSDEWVGTLFTLLLVLRTEEGHQLFTGDGKFTEEDMPLPESFADLDAKSDIDSLKECARMMQEATDKRKASAAQERNAANPESEDHIPPPELVNEDTGEIDNPEDLGVEDDVDGEEEELVTEKCSAYDFIALLEGLLCFHGWYKFGTFEKADLPRYQASISKLLAMLQYYVPRKTGNGWNLQKFHDILHLPFFMGRYGHPGNFDAEVGESGLRTWAKWAAGTAAKRGDKNAFVAQCAKRMDERLTLETARRELAAEGNTIPKLGKNGKRIPESKCIGGDIQLGGSRYEVPRLPGVATWLTGRASSRIGSTEVHPLVSSSLRSLEETNPRGSAGSGACPPHSGGEEDHWVVHTECSMAHPVTQKRFSMRCHPDYHAEGAWYDWVEVRYTGSSFQGDKDHLGTFLHKHSVPAKVLAFLEHPDSGAAFALVHPCKWRDNSEQDTVLTEVWHQDFNWRGDTGHPGVQLVRVDAIVGLCLVVEEVPGLKENVSKEEADTSFYTTVILVRDRKTWGDRFT